ncbi:MAG: hypothetical protein V7K90_01890 [Nostoc sp.]|uniref:hypothetical protein n=1 Tax=Nostoc sp. TaxID=1180 RepID=UPI002FFABA46
MAKSSMSQFEPLPFDAVVYRALLNLRQINSYSFIPGDACGGKLRDVENGSSIP